MEFRAIQQSITDIECDVLIVNLFEGVKHPGGGAGAVDSATGGLIASLIEREGFEGKLGETLDMTPHTGVKAGRVIVVGLGKADEFNLDKVRRASSAAARRAGSLKAKSAATILHGAGIGGLDPQAATRALVEGAILGTYEFIRHKTQDVKPNTLEQIDIAETDAGKLPSIEAGINLGVITADAVNFARDLVNEPANELTPTDFADRALLAFQDNGIECTVYGVNDIAQMGMDLLLAVAKGSRQEPKFIRMMYKSPDATRTVCLVGKGITFDSGGMNLKPSDSLKNMKDDMAGGAAVLAAMRAAASLKPNVNILALIPTTENMIGGNATRVGDIIRGLSGKTVEIDNTDAEGRLILADAVAYAEGQQADEIVDIATLTGACVVALGRDMAGVLGNNQQLVDRLVEAGKSAGEMLWQLPLHEDYQDNLKSGVADMKNSGSRDGGAITGALFIKNHIANTPWAHIDIAGPATIDKDTALAPKGATGFGVGTLINYLMGVGK